MSDRPERLKDLIEDKNNPERIFPILNKFDRIFTHHATKTFCWIYNDITQGQQLTDLEFTKRMDEYIEKNNIK